MIKTIELSPDNLATLQALGRDRDVAIARFEGAAMMLIPRDAQPHQLDTEKGTLTYLLPPPHAEPTE